MVLKLLFPFLFSITTWAQNAADIQLLTEKLSVVQAKTSTLGSADACAPDNKASCSFNNFCQSYSGRALQGSLYKNSSGEDMPNYLLLHLNSSVSRCTGAAEVRISENPLLYPADLLMGSSVKAADRKAYEAKVSKAEGLLQETKKRIIRLLQNKKSQDPAHNAKIDNMIARVDVIRLFSLKTGDAKSFFEKGCESPNAYYNPSDATVVMCPQMLAAPEASIMSVLAHEITHSIDPCTLDSTMKINGKAHGPLPLSVNPLKDVVMCLASPQAAHIKGLSQAEVKEGLERDAELLEMMGQPERAKEVQRMTKNLKKAHEDSMFCNSSGNKHIQEFFADWMSAQIMGEKVSEMPEGPKKKEFAMDAHAYHQSLSCPQIALEIVGNYKLSDKEAYQVCPDLAYPHQVVSDFDSRKKSSDQYPGVQNSHPATDTRVSNVFMAEPHLRQALGCKNTSSKTPQNCR